MSIEIHLFKEPSVKNPIIIEGFPGIGLVGTVACNYLVEKLGMEQIGYVYSEKFPPLASIHNYTPNYPTRIFESKKHNLLVLFSEFLIPIDTIHDLSQTILTWAKDVNAKKIVSLAGIHIMGAQDDVFGIANNEKDSNMIKKNGVKLIKEGASTGVNAILLIEGKMRDLDVISLLAESKPGYIDPLAASMVLEVLNKMLKLNVDTKPLKEESSKIEESMREIIKKAKSSKEDYTKSDQSFGQTYI